MSAYDWLLLGLGCLMLGTIGIFVMTVISAARSSSSRRDKWMDVLVTREAMNNIIRESSEDENVDHDEKWATAVQNAIALYRSTMLR